MSNLAEAKNLILFQKMAKNMIDGDLEIFREVTGLLTTWLSKRQAYYPSALFQIIRLLFIAQVRVRDEVKFGRGLELLFKAQQYRKNPFAEAYISLINATIPFQDVFSDTEKGLREGYQQLLASVSNFPEHEIPQISRIRSPTPRPIDSAESSRQLAPSSTVNTSVDLVFESLRSHTPNPNESIEPKISTPAESRSPSILQQIESSSGLNESKENTLPVSLAAGEQHLPIPMESQPAPAPILLDSEQIGIAPLDSDLDFGLSENKAFEGQQQSNDNVNESQGILPSTVTSNPEASISRSDISVNLQAGLTEATGVVTNVAVDSPLIPSTMQNPTGNVEVTSQMEVDPIKSSDELMASSQSLSVPTEYTTATVDISGDIGAGQNEGSSQSNAMEVDGFGSDKSIILPDAEMEQVVDEVANFPAPSASTNSTQMDSPASREMNVITRQQGLNGSFRIFIDFDITGDQFELIKRWSKRFGNSEELESSICITLGCYLLADLKEQSNNAGLFSFEQQVACTSSKWPQKRGSLSLNIISAESKEENLPLSPPFQVTPNNLLDISDLLAEGRNTLQLHQTTDLRHYLFVLHAHHPTPQQLEHVQGHMRKQTEWHQFLQGFAAPLAYNSLTSLLSSQAARA